MNKFVQPEVHPDAERLNAFVERALPQSERVQVMAHLGGCARCREIVFLAQRAAGADTESPQAASAGTAPAQASPNIARPGKAWRWAGFGKWRIALIPAAALAAAAGLLIWVQMKPAPAPPTVAQTSIPPSPPPPSMMRQAASKGDSVGAKTAQPNAAQSAEHPAKQESVAPSSRLSARGTEPDALHKLRAERDLGSTPTAMPPQEAGLGLSQSSTQESALVRARPQAAEMQDKRWAAAKHAADAQVPPPPPQPNMAAVHGRIMAPATGGPRPLLAEAMPTGQMNSSQLDSGQMELMPAGNGLATLQVISHPRLPSGLNPVSSAVMLDRVVAIDSAGSVFLSRDAAKHWEPVPVQWTGKAIAVQAPPRPLHPFSRAVNQETILHTTSAVTPATGASGPALPPASASAEPPPPATASEGQSREAASDKIAPPAPGPSPPAQASAGPTMPGMLFRLSNDRHETWVSADGRIWRPQSPAH